MNKRDSTKKDEALEKANKLAKEDAEREAEERRVAEEEAEDERKAAALAAIAIPRRNPKVERLCKMIVKGSGMINYDHRKRACEIAKQLLTPVEAKEGAGGSGSLREWR